MKHIKPFNESESYSLEDVTSHIKDMALDFMDEGLDVVVKSMSIDRFDNQISVSIDTGFISQDRLHSPDRFNKSDGLTISASKIIEFSERIESYLGMQNIVYEIIYQWHDNHGHFHEKKPVWKKEKLRNVWIEIYMEK